MVAGLQFNNHLARRLNGGAFPFVDINHKAYPMRAETGHNERWNLGEYKGIKRVSPLAVGDLMYNLAMLGVEEGALLVIF